MRESGLLFPPDPSAAEQSQIGGNIATNAGGPHAFKYGVTGQWVTGIDAVLAPGELVKFGGPVRKDVAGYDLRALMIGSEGTLGVITGAWLRLIPAPEAQLPVAAFYRDVSGGAAAIERTFASGVVPAALEFLDAGALAAAARSFPWSVPEEPGFMVIVEADGFAAAAAAARDELAAALAEGALLVIAPEARAEVDALWKWRDGVSLAVTARRGGKVSEDIAVPVERLSAAVVEAVAIGRRYALETVNWGHAGDGNLHATFLIDPANEDEIDRAERAAGELFALALALGGSVSGEHGIGLVKLGQLERQWEAAAVAAAQTIKRALDPKGLLNPGKKLRGTPTSGGD